MKTLIEYWYWLAVAITWAISAICLFWFLTRRKRERPRYIKPPMPTGMRLSSPDTKKMSANDSTPTAGTSNKQSKDSIDPKK